MMRREKEIAVKLLRLPESVLHQVLFNLISNAMDASPGGNVNVGVQRSHEYVTFVVADDGTGIPSSIKHRVFEPFFTTNGDGHSRATMGIGLSIVREIADSFGGHISWESEPGRGTTFRVSFPAVPEQAQP